MYEEEYGVGSEADDVVRRPADRSLPAGIVALDVIDFNPFPSAAQLPGLFSEGAQTASDEIAARGG
eukprot:4351612-Karenia_brevis.AAC.1